MSSAIGGLFLRQLPSELLTGVQLGTHKVFGSIVREASTGRIAGFLQETSLTPQLVRRLSSGAPGLGADLLGHGISYVQNQRIEAAVEVVRGLQSANLLLSAAGIGVTAVTGAVLAAKVARVERAVEGLGGRMDDVARGVENLRRDRIAEDLDNLRTLSEQLEEGWLLPDPVPQWRGVALDAHKLANLFERRAAEAAERELPDLGVVALLTDAFALAAAARVKARLAAGDNAVALQAAHEGASALVRLTDGVNAGALVIRRMAGAGIPPTWRSWGAKMESEADAIRSEVGRMRAQEAAAVSSALAIRQVAEQGLKGRDWLEAVRAEQDTPLLFVPCRFSPRGPAASSA